MLFTVAEHPFHSPILGWKRNGRLYVKTKWAQRNRTGPKCFEELWLRPLSQDLFSARVVSRTFLFLYKTFILLALPARLSLISLNLHIDNLHPFSRCHFCSSSKIPSSSRISPSSPLPNPPAPRLLRHHLLSLHVPQPPNSPTRLPGSARPTHPYTRAHPSSQVYLHGRHEIFQSPYKTIAQRLIGIFGLSVTTSRESPRCTTVSSKRVRKLGAYA